MAFPPHVAVSCSVPGCEVCGNEHPFDLPEELVDAAKAGRLVVFAGAGVSTETRAVFKTTLYEDVAMELDIDPRTGPPFPDLMSRYCNQPNGRSQLLVMIKKRFDYMRSFPELYRTATRFHRELATIPYIQDIVTTNWDDLFESECGATPIVVPEDFVFWNLPGRKVYKIHGSINNLGTIVATDEDYKKCYKRLIREVMGGNLRLMLATRVVVFIGYSFNDFDFQKIHRFLSREMKGLLPHAYVVTLDERASERFASANVTPIITDGSCFLRVLKDRLIGEKLMLADERFDDLQAQYALVRGEHHTLLDRFDLQDSPGVLFTACWQDGFLHALEFVLSRRRTGYCSNPANIFRAIHSYDHIRKEKVQEKRYDDVAYIDGYVDGLLFFVADDQLRDQAPRYYAYAYKGHIQNLDELRKAVDETETRHKSAYAYAKRITDTLGSGTVYHHRPFL